MNEIRVKTDRICDYIPLVSTATNLVNLFQRTITLLRSQNKSDVKNNYYEHLQKKSFARCCVLLIPVLGNVIIGLYIYKEQKKAKDDKAKDDALILVKQDGFNLQDVSAALQGDKDVVLAAVQKCGLALEYASEELKNDREIVLAAVQKYGVALRYASEELKKNDKEIATFL